MPKLINYMFKEFPAAKNSEELIPLAIEIQKMLENAPIFQRSRPILMRKVTPDDVGKKLVTWVKDPDTGNPRVEGDGVTLKEGMIILRNPNPIVSVKTASGMETIYNEYASNDIVYMNREYGKEVLESLKEEFQLKRKKGQFTAVQITAELFDKFVEMGCVDEKNEIHIAVEFEPFVMSAVTGGWLNSNGYAIGEVEMRDNYELVLDQEPPRKQATVAPAITKHSALFNKNVEEAPPCSTETSASQKIP